MITPWNVTPAIWMAYSYLGVAVVGLALGYLIWGRRTAE